MADQNSTDQAGTTTKIIYPVLFALFPLLSIYSTNLAMIPFVTLLRPTITISIVSVLLWFIFGIGLKNFSRGAICSTVVITMCYLFTKVQLMTRSFYVPNQFEIWIWSFLTIALTGLAAWRFSWHKLANVLSITLISITLLQICLALFQAAQFRPDTHSTLGNHSKAVFRRPDIIYIILDGYGRSDALKRSLGYDNSKFIDGLERLGFFVASNSRSNYCQTELSVGSSLNLDFIQNLLPKVDAKNGDRLALGELINHNAASLYLRAKGYSFRAITTDFPPLQFESADVNLRSRSGLTMIESAILQISPWASDGRAVDSQFVRRRDDLMAAIEAISKLWTRDIVPRFVVAHILAPHPPFVFGANGETVPRKGLYGFWDGSDYLEHVSSEADYTTGYVGQAEYIGTQLLSAIDSVLSSSGEKPVIIIQGDHGSKLRLDQNSLDKTDLNECFPILNAFYVPNSVQKGLYSSISPVNSFRAVFNGLFHENYQLKPDLSWYSTYPLPYDMTDVTNQIADSSKLKYVQLPKK